MRDDDMAKKFLLGIGLFIIAVVIGGLYNGLISKNDGVAEVQIGNAVFEVEIADTAAKRSRGLSGVLSLPENKGMLFVFNKPDTYSFWMKDMNFPLDIIWISKDSVVGIEQSVFPEWGTADKYLRRYYSPEPVDTALEINAGLAEKFEIEAGDEAIVSY